MLEQFEQQFAAAGYQQPTAIQTAMYEPMINGEGDVVGLSPTGSGKTLAFLMPILANVLAGAGTQAIILEPSQELAIQVTEVARTWARPFQAKILPLIGGANVKRQQEQLKRRPEVVIGTPGRVLSLLTERKLKATAMDTLVIDEADDLLQDDSLAKVQQILAALPRKVQVAYFSATDSPILHELEPVMGKPATVIDVRAQDQTRGPVRHGLFRVARANRNGVLQRLAGIPNFKSLIFFNQSETLNRAYNYFNHQSQVPVAKLSGAENKLQRERALTGFRKGQVRFLLTTDVAARGLDIPKLPAVINYDLPRSATTYVHRVGRTGRMGEPGLVLNFGDDHDLRDLKKLIRPVGYEPVTMTYYEKQLVTERPEPVKPPVNQVNQEVSVKHKPTHKKHRQRDRKNKGRPRR
ncbi:DEAD/DEAH box helicase [Fructilactobacillus florum]|uniref:DEAD/DEAH box helicase n=1 Tax=Fructilactobacillus florum TaxID=640331 RepID=UPI00028E9FC9|nr:DEAD/DEAH box helicase [Fructilactobacillus florum]EKK20074.1 ATP-dependent RNA helicase YfmL [Fructilactobacillus florum 2F]